MPTERFCEYVNLLIISWDVGYVDGSLLGLLFEALMAQVYEYSPLSGSCVVCNIFTDWLYIIRGVGVFRRICMSWSMLQIDLICCAAYVATMHSASHVDSAVIFLRERQHISVPF